MKSHLTVIYPYYENAKFFAMQLAHWMSLPSVMLGQLSFVVVDDCSPGTSAADVVRGQSVPLSLDLRIFRIGVDVRWNWLAARNVGAHHARDGWLLLTDMDHVISEKTMSAVLNGEHDSDVIYRFSRREHDGRKIHPHPNSWLMTREMYWHVGGYDEALSGFYGTDGEYRRRCAATAPVVILPDELERHEYVLDSSTTRYMRKQPEDAEGKRRMRARGRDWKPRVLSFPYGEVTP